MERMMEERVRGGKLEILIEITIVKKDRQMSYFVLFFGPSRVRETPRQYLSPQTVHTCGAGWA
jgi:hypothetical protein